VGVTAATSLSQRVCVLFVDDEKSVTDGLVRLLRNEPYTILTAGSASAALEIIASHHVDIVVSDEGMPGGSGSDLLALVRMRNPEIIRIILTGEAELETLVHAIREGRLYRFLSKPITGQELVQVLQQAANMKRLADQRTERSTSVAVAGRRH